MARITFQTGTGKFIDIVDERSEVVNEFYILKSDVTPMYNFLVENKVERITNNVAKVLMDKGYLKRDEVPF